LGKTQNIKCQVTYVHTGLFLQVNIYLYMYMSAYWGISTYIYISAYRGIFISKHILCIYMSTYWGTSIYIYISVCRGILETQHTNTHANCSVLQCGAVCCSVLQRITAGTRHTHTHTHKQITRTRESLLPNDRGESA